MTVYYSIRSADSLKNASFIQEQATYYKKKLYCVLLRDVKIML